MLAKATLLQRSVSVTSVKKKGARVSYSLALARLSAAHRPPARSRRTNLMDTNRAYGLALRARPRRPCSCSASLSSEGVTVPVAGTDPWSRSAHQSVRTVGLRKSQAFVKLVKGLVGGTRTYKIEDFVSSPVYAKSNNFAINERTGLCQTFGCGQTRALRE